MATVVRTLEQKRAHPRLFQCGQRLLAQQKRVSALSACGYPVAQAQRMLAIFADSQLLIYAAICASRANSQGDWNDGDHHGFGM